jgi:hypothetical protein
MCGTTIKMVSIIGNMVGSVITASVSSFYLLELCCVRTSTTGFLSVDNCSNLNTDPGLFFRSNDNSNLKATFLPMAPLGSQLHFRINTARIYETSEIQLSAQGSIVINKVYMNIFVYCTCLYIYKQPHLSLNAKMWKNISLLHLHRETHTYTHTHAHARGCVISVSFDDVQLLLTF